MAKQSPKTFNIGPITLVVFVKTIVFGLFRPDSDINEQITGAISENKKYGWVFYFSMIDDIALLHRLDRIVEKLCKKCRTLLKKKPKKIKSFVVAFREVHKLRQGVETSYIPSYDEWKTQDKVVFLRERGLSTKKSDVDRLFKVTLRKRLLNLERDVKNIS